MESISGLKQKDWNSDDAVQSLGRRGLILDDSSVDRLRIRRLCQQAELEIDFTDSSTIAEFASKIDTTSFDLFFLDYRLVQGDGLIALEMLKRHPLQKSAVPIMVASESQIQVAIDAMKSGCADFLLKDRLGPESLSRSVSRALAQHGDDNSKDDPSLHLERALIRFARQAGVEMRSILSALLRRTRALRHATAANEQVCLEDIAKIDENCARLWEFLEEYQILISDYKASAHRLN